MDSKVFRMALLTIISVFILIAVIVYATNADKINGLLGKKQKAAETDISAAEVSAVIPQNLYGEQIGDNLSGFLYDEDFFDETERIPSVVVIKKASSSSSADEDESSFDDVDDYIIDNNMAVVGQLENPDALASVPEAAEGISLPAVVPIEGGN